jgi:hypothetical protein
MGIIFTSMRTFFLLVDIQHFQTPELDCAPTAEVYTAENVNLLLSSQNE